MTKEKQQEMKAEQQRDQQIPLNLEDNESGADGADNANDETQTKNKKQTKDEVDESQATKQPEMTEKEASKMLRKLNKKADENIKMLNELNTDMSLTSKCDDSKTKRSSVKTTNMVKGKKSRKKDSRSRIKKLCISIQNYARSRQRQKKGCYDLGCVSDWCGAMCATERNEDCTVKKVLDIVKINDIAV